MEATKISPDQQFNPINFMPGFFSPIRQSNVYQNIYFLIKKKQQEKINKKAKKKKQKKKREYL